MQREPGWRDAGAAPRYEYGQGSQMSPELDYRNLLAWPQSLPECQRGRRRDLLTSAFRAYKFESRLGGGSISVVLLVEHEGTRQVLKLAPDPQYNACIREEFQVLSDIQEKVRSRLVVAPFLPLEFEDIQGFTMELAGERTLARHPELLMQTAPMQDAIGKM